MNAASPMTARSTRLFAPICRNYDKDLPVEDAYAFNLKIFEEDRLIVENQKHDLGGVHSLNSVPFYSLEAYMPLWYIRLLQCLHLQA